MKRLAILILGLSLTCTPATAQLYRVESQPAPKTDEPEEPLEPDKAEQAMEKFSSCLLREPARQHAAMEYLQIPNGDPEQGKRGAALTKRGCVPDRTRQMRFQPALFRYSLFSSLYQKYFSKVEPNDFDKIGSLNFSAEFNQARAPISEFELAVRGFGDCVARRNPKYAHTLLMADVRSNIEKNAISSLMPDLSACLSDGVELKFSRTVIRGILAEAMYKLGMASTSSSDRKAQN